MEMMPGFHGDGDHLLRAGLKLNHLRMIVALDDLEQVSGAASVLNMSQPAASRMLGEMEAVLGVSLYQRLPRGISLNEYGRAFARRARNILLELREVDREISDLRSGYGGAVFLGAVTAPAVELAVPAIQKIKALHPRVQVNIQVETSTVLANELLASRHDFIIARIPDDLNPGAFEIQEIGIEKASLIVRRDHPLMGRRRVGLADLQAFDWVFQPVGSLLRRTVERIFLTSNIAWPEKVLNTSSLLMTLIMVRQSDAIAPVSTEVARFLVDQEGLGGNVDILPIEFEIDVQPYGLVKLAKRTLSPTAQLLYDAIVEQIEARA
ncbi:MAG: LysR family transcriptional regulator [Phyllobacterium sp.]